MPKDPDDDDPATLDWGEQANTAVDDEPITVVGASFVPEADTAKFRSLDYQTGREAGFTAGVDRTLRVIGAELVRAGLSRAEASPILSRVQDRANERG